MNGYWSGRRGNKMSKLIIGMLVLMAVGYLILAIANLYQWYSVWWAAFDIFGATLFLFMAWAVRELDKGESNSVKDIFWKRYVAGGSVLWLYAYKVCGGKK